MAKPCKVCGKDVIGCPPAAQYCSPGCFHNDLDRWLAEKFEPEPWMKEWPEWWTARKRGKSMIIVGPFRGDKRDKDNLEWSPRFKLSKSWQGAGRVIEAMKARGYCACYYASEVTHWARFGVDAFSCIGVNAHTGPEAIALAARAALEEEDG